MKTTKCIALALIAIINLTACSSDDDSTPEVINEEEVITTITVITYFTVFFIWKSSICVRAQLTL